jgi:hypothetical protein
VIQKHLDEVLRTRGVFIVLEFVEHAETARLLLPHIQAKKKEVVAIAKSLPHAKGLQILLSKLN